MTKKYEIADFHVFIFPIFFTDYKMFIIKLPRNFVLNSNLKINELEFNS